MGAKRVLLLVFGSLIALIGLGLTIGGSVGLIAYGTGRDADGFFTTETERFATPRSALVSDEVDLGAEGDVAGSASLGDIARVRVRAEAVTGLAVFVGIGPRDDVARYLAGVAYDEVTDVEFDPFRVAYRPRPGLRPPVPPAQQTFWVASATGIGQQALEWDLEGGEWNLVVMNADGSLNVLVDMDLGVEVKVLLPVSIGLLIGGLVLLGIGITMIVFGSRSRGGGGGGGPPATAAAPTTPPRHESPY